MLKNAEDSNKVEKKATRPQLMTPMRFVVIIFIVASILICIAIVFFYRERASSLNGEKSAAESVCQNHCMASPYFGSAIVYLEEQTDIPILLPTELPKDLMNIPLEVDTLDPPPQKGGYADYYELQIFAHPSDCNWPAGQNCFIGDMRAQPNRTLSVKGEPVNLADNIQGVYEDGVQENGLLCSPGFSCGTLTWVEGNILYAYSFGFSYPQGTVVDMANSAIKDGTS